MMKPLDIAAIRAEFPILARQVNGKPLVYLDNAASAHKPRAVIDAMRRAMEGSYANVHRGLHTLANETTSPFEAARKTAAAFLNAGSPEEIVFTAGGTDAINLVANSLGQAMGEGDEVILSRMEHHSNIVPWHFLRERKGAIIRWAPIRDDGSMDLGAFEKQLTPRTKLVAITHKAQTLDTLVFDKTGTLTRGIFAFQNMVACGVAEDEALSRVASLEVNCEHFLAHEIVRIARQRKLPLFPVNGFENLDGLGVRGLLKDGEVIAGNRSLISRAGYDLARELDEAAHTLESQGTTVVFFGWQKQVKGFVCFGDTLKESSPQAIQD